MVLKTKQTPTSGTEYEQQFLDWVYQVPGAFLIVFGGLVLLSIT